MGDHKAEFHERITKAKNSYVLWILIWGFLMLSFLVFVVQALGFLKALALLIAVSGFVFYSGRFAYIGGMEKAFTIWDHGLMDGMEMGARVAEAIAEFDEEAAFNANTEPDLPDGEDTKEKDQ